MSDSYHIYPNVLLGDNVILEDFVIVGQPPRGRDPGQSQTLIGAGSTIDSKPGTAC